MIMWVRLTPVSYNAKTGPIPVSTTSSDSCPPSCPLNGTDCYARFGNLARIWKQTDAGKASSNWEAFLKRVRKFAISQIWRHNQAGDLPGSDDVLDAEKCKGLSDASKHTRGFTYTHYDPRVSHNGEIIREMNSVSGMTVNLSADSLTEADELHATGCGPIVVTLPMDAKAMGNVTPGGLPIVVCPAQTTEYITCAQCKLCQVRERKSIVGFLAHGTTKRRLSKKLA